MLDGSQITLTLNADQIAELRSEIDSKLESIKQEIIAGIRSSQTTTSQPDRVLTEREAAALIGVAPRTLAGWRRDGFFAPTFPKKPIRYTAEDVDRVKEFAVSR